MEVLDRVARRGTDSPEGRGLPAAVRDGHGIETIHVPEALPPFRGYLYVRAELAYSLRSEIAPLVAGGPGMGESDAILVMAPEHGGMGDRELSAEAQELKRVLQQRGLTVRGVYHAAPAVMLQLARESVLPNAGTSNAAISRRDNESTLMNLFMEPVKFAEKMDASDIHFRYDATTQHSQVRFRIMGKLVDPRNFNVQSKALIDALSVAYSRSTGGVGAGLSLKDPQQCMLQLAVNNRAIALRWASTATVSGLVVVNRVLRLDATTQRFRSLAEAGYLPDQVRQIENSIQTRGGVTLVAGTVGSGKTTTMSICLKKLPKWMAKYTIEDPAEYIDPELNQIQISRSLNDRGDEDPFLAIKRQMKRLDLDVCLIGELRDRVTGSVARDIAESGHRAFGTVHAQSCTGVLSRLSDEEIGIPRDVLAAPGVLNLTAYQALIPTLCDCAYTGEEAAKVIEASMRAQRIREATNAASYLAHLVSLYSLTDISRVRARNEKGCPKCRRTYDGSGRSDDEGNTGFEELNGIKDRVVVAEIMEVGDEHRKLIAQSDHLGLRQLWRSQRTARFDEPGSAGKSAREIGVYHMVHGLIDPREIEDHFGAWPAALEKP